LKSPEAQWLPATCINLIRGAVDMVYPLLKPVKKLDAMSLNAALPILIL
jgi:hypothetical protein